MPNQKSLCISARYGATITDRDGGWWCAYCRRPLLAPGQPQIPLPVIQWTYIDHFSGEQLVQRITEHSRLIGGYNVQMGLAWWDVDHRIARARGGSDDLKNLVLACVLCNSRKQAHPPNVFQPKIDRWVATYQHHLERAYRGELS